MKTTAKFQTESEGSGPTLVTPRVRQAAEQPSVHTQKALDWTAYKNNARNGDTLGAMPAALAALPAAVLANLFGRVSALAARIKKHSGCTEAMGEDLGITGAEQTVDPSILKPSLGLTMQAGRPNVGWTNSEFLPTMPKIYATL